MAAKAAELTILASGAASAPLSSYCCCRGPYGEGDKRIGVSTCWSNCGDGESDEERKRTKTQLDGAFVECSTVLTVTTMLAPPVACATATAVQVLLLLSE